MTVRARPLRADAARNRDQLLTAAQDEFAEHGLEASVADIAHRAGVAKGTVFRHFATKDELVAAVVVRHMAELCEVARGLSGSDDAGGALLEFLTVTAARRRQRDLTVLTSAASADPAVARVRDQLHEDIAALVKRAHEDGALRADVTATDVFLLTCAPVQVAENLPGAPVDLWRRYLAIIFDGLRPEGANPLPEPAPDWN